MKKSKNVIVINGRHYDSKTGESLHPHGSAEPARHAPRHKAVSRTAASHANHHAPSRSKTLMRHAVKKPAGSPKQRIKVQSRLGAPAERRNVSHVSKVQIISHFSPELFKANFMPAAKPGLVIKPVVEKKAKPTTDELFEYAVKHAPAHEAPVKHRRKLHRRTARAAA